MGGAGTQPTAYYRPAEVAKLLRCSEWWIKEQARRRRIPYAWIGGSYLFTAEHVNEIVRLFEIRPTGEAPMTGRQGSVASAAAVAQSVGGAVLLHARPPRRPRRVERPAA
jgi:excisionase family DNA binding protein